MNEYRLSPKEQRRIEEGWDNDREAHRLLDLIVAEFVSDPMSVQCFDLRIVEQAKVCVAKRKVFEKNDPFGYYTRKGNKS